LLPFFLVGQHSWQKEVIVVIAQYRHVFCTVFDWPTCMLGKV